MSAVIAGLLLAASFPPIGWVILLPFGLALLMSAMDGSPPRIAFYLGMLTGSVFYGIGLRWLFGLFGAPAIPMIVILAAYLGLFAGLLAYARKRLPKFPVWISAPVLWTGIEAIRSEHVPLAFGWFAPGYATVNSPAFSAMASVVGSYGISFFLVTMAVLALERWRGGVIGRVGVAGLVAVWIPMVLLRVSPPLPNAPVSVRLVQARNEALDDMEAQSRKTPGRPLDLLVWPEYSFLSDPRKDLRRWKAIQDVARQNETTLVFGAKDEFGVVQFRNTAFVLGPSGDVIGTHVKNHTVYFIKDGEKGSAAVPVKSRMGRLGVAICFDMDFPDVARRLASNGAELFVVPNMDPDEWGSIQREQHRLLFQMRAAECGRWLVRADVAGGTSVSAPNGQEAARIDTLETGHLDALVGRETHLTPYVRWGWRFGQLSVLGSMALLSWSWARRRKSES